MTKAHYVDAASQHAVPLSDETIHLENLTRQLAQKSTELEKTQRDNVDQRHRILQLENRLATVVRECDEAAHSARGALAHLDDVVMQSSLRQENWLLKDQLAKVREQQRNFALAETGSLAPAQQTIEEELGQIRFEVDNACSSLDVACPTRNSIQEMRASDVDEALISWAWRLAQCRFSELASWAVSNMVPEFDVIRAIAAVGVCDMVFESDFPGLEARESPLLDQYRKQILTRGNEDITYSFKRRSTSQRLTRCLSLQLGLGYYTKPTY
jgi:hypothetical protein